MSDQSIVSPAAPVAQRSSSRWPIFGLLVLVALAVCVTWLSQPRVPSLLLENRLIAADEKSDAKSDKPAKKETKPAAKKSADNAKDEDKETEPEKKGLENPFPRRFKLSGDELSGGVEWLNTSGEIELKDLRGKVVLLDFWTYCCINCMHILPDLKFLEHKYPKELVVIGVHSAKFDNEKDSENIRRAALRYEIEHPIVNDAEMKIWRGFGVRAWPTIGLIDPEGYFCGVASGEGNRELLDEVIAKLIAYHRAKGTLDETPVQFDLERNRVKPDALRFPGKVLADEASDRLFITDSNHNRIVITSLTGKLLDVIGTGVAGATDGNYKTATFFRPQGTVLVGDNLYVADTENHMLRVIDLKAKKVTTLAGTGKQAQFRDRGGSLRKTALNSPWAISHVDGTLYIAMAGPHQLFAHEIGSDEITVFAGSGREDILNGTLAESAFAQPSGITVGTGKVLFVADSEGSSIRKVTLGAKGEVTTVAGASDLPQGQTLFAFGDIDEVGGKARFQHPLDVLFHEGALYVADSYNHKVKRVDLANRKVTTLLGTGKSGASLDPVKLAEPAGLSAVKNKLFIADTNNHRILVATLPSGEVSELKIEGLLPPPPAKEADDTTESKDVIAVPTQDLKSGDNLNFQVSFKLPEGYKLNKLAKVTYKLEAAGEQGLVVAEQLKARKVAEVKEDSAAISIPLAKKEGDAMLSLSVTFSYCRDGVGGVCKIKTVRWSIPVKASSDGKVAAIKLEAAAE